MRCCSAFSLMMPDTRNVGYSGFRVKSAHTDSAATQPSLICAAALLGHMYSPYLGFHGGKGIAVGFGVMVAWLWPVGLSLWIPFLIGVIVTRYVSVGSIAAAISFPIWAYVYYPALSPVSLGILTVLAALVVWAHRKNIVKLAHGEESKLSFSSKKK